MFRGHEGLTGLGDMLSPAGDASGWLGGNAQASVPATDQRPHVDGYSDGGVNGVNSNANASGDAKLTLYGAVGVVLLATVLYVVLGKYAFRSFNH